jgi:hypothetical protein
MPARIKEGLRLRFRSEFGLRPAAWTSPNYKKFLDNVSRGNSAVRAAVKGTLASLGLQVKAGTGLVPDEGGIFVESEFWSKDDFITTLVAHPVRITNENLIRLKELSIIDGVDVKIDDRESYGGHGSHHVRISVAGLKSPGEGSDRPFHRSF